MAKPLSRSPRTGQRKALSVYMNREIVAYVESEAARQERSVSQYLERCVRLEKELSERLSKR
jgi:hypothetical protein